MEAEMRVHTVVLLVPLLAPYFANAAEAPRAPIAVLDSLADRIYVLGETGGNVSEMVAAEAEAADEVGRYVASGAVDGLLPKEKGKQAPLVAAAYMGYPKVVAALLTSELVRSHINDVDDMGLTPWIAANFSMRMSLWTCRPAVFDDPYKFVPMFVTQPYYALNPTPPYLKTRELLEKAGAHVEMAKAKEIWLSNCKNESTEAASTVGASADLLKTVQQLGASDLATHMRELQKKAAMAH